MRFTLPLTELDALIIFVSFAAGRTVIWAGDKHPPV